MNSNDDAVSRAPSAALDRPPAERSRLRVAIDARKWRDYGIGTYLRNLVPQLAALPTELSLTAYADAGTVSHHSHLPNIRWVQESAPPYSLTEQWALRRMGREDGHGRHDLLHLPHYVVPWLPSCPFVVTIHDTIHLRYPENLPHRGAKYYAQAMLHRAAFRSRKIITVSEVVKRDLICRYALDENKIVVIPHGLPGDVQPAERLQHSEAVLQKYGIAAPYLFSAANYAKRHKDLPLLLEAYRRLAGLLPPERPLPSLVVAGNLPDPPPRPTGSGGVRFLGHLPRCDLLALLANASLFLWSSCYEGFGLPVLEAMGSGTAVVATAGGAIPEVLGDGGMLVPPGEAPALAAAVAELWVNSEKIGRLARRGLERARQFDWATQARKTMAVYREAAGLE